MNFKIGVKNNSTRNEIWFAIGFVEAICLSFSLEFTITSLVDGTHSENSLHYKGLAFDFRTRDFTEEQLSSLFSYLKYRLKLYGYDVIKEEDHIHIEYDPKGRHLFKLVD